MAMVKDVLQTAIPPKFLEDFDSFLYCGNDHNHHFYRYIIKLLQLTQKEVQLLGPVAARETSSERLIRRLNKVSKKKQDRLLVAYKLIKGKFNDPWFFHISIQQCLNGRSQAIFPIHSSSEISAEAKRKVAEYGAQYVPCIVFYSDKRLTKKMMIDKSTPCLVLKTSQSSAVYRYNHNTSTFFRVADYDTLSKLQRKCALKMVFLYVFV